MPGMARLAALLGSLALGSLALAACSGDRPGSASSFAAALEQARAAHTQVVLHFRLPGRPVSDAMDAALSPSVLHAIAGDVVHLRVDAEHEADLFARTCGGGPRRGPGLATCIVDPAAADDALAVHTGYLTPQGLRQLLADAAGLRAALRQCGDRGPVAEARREFVLGEHFARCGRRDRACRLFAASFAATTGADRGRCAARLARLAIEDGDLVAARAWLADAGPGRHATLTRALVHLAAREPGAALRLLRDLTSPAPASPADAGEAADPPARVLALLGRAYHESGDDDAALATLARVASDFAGSEEAAQATREAAHVRAKDHGHSHAATPP